MVARLIKCQNGPLFSNNKISIKIASGKIEISNAHWLDKKNPLRLKSIYLLKI